MQWNLTTLIAGLLAIGCLAGAIFLQWSDIDATQAWTGFGLALGILAGQQMATPGEPEGGVGK